jgi:hypothetical protein
MAKKKSAAPKAGDTVRVKIPHSLQQEVLIEAGYKCARPVCHNVIALQLHHMIYVSDGGCNESSNLLPLCGYCHDMHHRHEFSSEAIRVWKGLLVALNQAFDRKSIDLLLLLHKQFSGTFYTADGMLWFAGLIAAGLATFGAQQGGGSSSTGGGVPSVHQVVLTEKGRLLVEAWLSGDVAKYRAAMSKTT